MRTSSNIYKRKNGLYEGRFKNGFKKDGTTRYTSVYAKTYLECKEKLKLAVSTPMIVHNKITMDELFSLYIERLSKVSTVGTYMTLYQAHIAPVLGGVRVAMITSDQVNKLLMGLLERLTEAHVANVKRLIMALLNFAVLKKYRSEKLTDILKIKTTHKEVNIFNDDELQRIEYYCLTHLNRITLGILLVLYSGIRIGELCALRIYDLDLKSGYLRINKTMTRVKNLENNATRKTKIVIDSPKSNGAIRDIPIPQFLISLYRDFLQNGNKNAYLLTDSVDYFIEPRNMENYFKRILKECCIEPHNFHILRHTFATNSLVKNYYDIKTLSEILGHSDVMMTLRKYVHSNKLIKSMQVQNIDNDWNCRINSGNNLKKAL